MGLIKKEQVEEKGVLQLKGEEAELTVAYGQVEIPEIEITAEEYPSLDRIEDKAREIIEQARQEAGQIREEAQTQARMEGIEEGKKEGLAQVADHIQQSLETLNQAVKERDKIIKDAESEILRLSLKIAEQVIKSEVTMHRDVILNIVSEALSRISDRETVIIKANREDVEHLKKYKDRLSGIIDGVKSFSILEDSQVEPGGVVIETNLGYVDARISTKLKAVEEALKKLEEKPQNGN